MTDSIIYSHEWQDVCQNVIGPLYAKLMYYDKLIRTFYAVIIYDTTDRYYKQDTDEYEFKYHPDSYTCNIVYAPNEDYRLYPSIIPGIEPTSLIEPYFGSEKYRRIFESYQSYHPDTPNKFALLFTRVCFYDGMEYRKIDHSKILGHLSHFYLTQSLVDKKKRLYYY